MGTLSDTIRVGSFFLWGTEEDIKMRKRVWVLALLGTALILTGCLGGGGTDGYGTL